MLFQIIKQKNKKVEEKPIKTFKTRNLSSHTTDFIIDKYFPNGMLWIQTVKDPEDNTLYETLSIVDQYQVVFPPEETVVRILQEYAFLNHCDILYDGERGVFYEEYTISSDTKTYYTYRGSEDKELFDISEDEMVSYYPEEKGEEFYCISPTSKSFVSGPHQDLKEDGTITTISLGKITKKANYLVVSTTPLNSATVIKKYAELRYEMIEKEILQGCLQLDNLNYLEHVPSVSLSFYSLLNLLDDFPPTIQQEFVELLTQTDNQLVLKTEEPHPVMEFIIDYLPQSIPGIDNVFSLRYDNQEKGYVMELINPTTYYGYSVPEDIHDCSLKGKTYYGQKINEDSSILVNPENYSFGVMDTQHILYYQETNFKNNSFQKKFTEIELMSEDEYHSETRQVLFTTHPLPTATIMTLLLTHRMDRLSKKEFNNQQLLDIQTKIINKHGDPETISELKDSHALEQFRKQQHNGTVLSISNEKNGKSS